MARTETSPQPDARHMAPDDTPTPGETPSKVITGQVKTRPDRDVPTPTPPPTAPMRAADARQLFSVALAAQRAGDLARADRLYRQAIALDPTHLDALNNLGVLLADLQRPNEAEAMYRRALQVDAGYADAWINLGNLLESRKRSDEAERCYLEAIRLNPASASARINLGALLAAQNRLKAAESAYRAAIALDPDSAEAYNNLGMVLYRQHRVREATDAFRRAYALRPDLAQALCKIPYSKRNLCVWDGLDDDDAEVLRFIEQGRPSHVTPFALLSIPATRPEHLRDAGRLRVQHLPRAILDAPPLTTRAVARPGARLRLGYLSADFQEHATTHLLAGVIEAHDRTAFDLHLYSYGGAPDDTYRQRLRDAGGAFTDLSRLSDADAARRIADDGIDLLVDLKGFTRNSRIGITVRRPAPVIVNWLGYPGTLGHPRLADYLIGDAIVTPLAHASHFSETLALLPHCYQPNDRARAIGPTPSRAEAGLPEQGLVLCSFNQAYKIDPAMFSVWCRLLDALPGSVLWLLDPKAEEARANLRREAAARGVDPQRLVFAPRLGQAAHLGRLRLADLALDTFPVTSHTTGSDALWAGVPLITRLGETFASRVAASLLHAVGLPELVCADEAAYFDLALALGRDPARLADLRARLDRLRLTSPLFDTARFTRNLERLYQAIWHQALRGQRVPIVPAG